MAQDDSKFRNRTAALAEQFAKLCTGKNSHVTLTALAGYLIRSWVCMEGREDESRKRLGELIDDLWTYELAIHPEHAPGEAHKKGLLD